jgi:hypothetical protein
MKELIARLEKATGPDRVLDRLLCHELSPGTENFCDGMRQEIPRYTASIDAALSLKESTGYSLIEFEYGGCQAEVDGGLADGPTAPLAILRAIFDSKSSDMNQSLRAREAMK